MATGEKKQGRKRPGGGGALLEGVVEALKTNLKRNPNQVEKI